MERKMYSTKEVLAIVGISKATLYNWLRAGKVPEVLRDRNNYRLFSEEDIKRIKEYKEMLRAPMRSFEVRQQRNKEGNNFS